MSKNYFCKIRDVLQFLAEDRNDETDRETLGLNVSLEEIAGLDTQKS
ncbi:hypothetical protein SAMN04487926_11610 [Paraburkholderia steynii]|uniref:Uncharacterized protein n=1 Tax=Paraburkholderia steynii TaxID=1245441 RepID=A0A7Z7FKW3_9BURK|nr:hypothetical protein SAMN04487926_11610 [Paraburkholderia steynii]